MTTHSPFAAVRDALTILLDERSAPEDRIHRATDLLRGLNVPTAAEQEETARAVRAFEQELHDQGQAITFTLGDDGQFHETVYRPAEGEQPLNDHEGAGG